LKFLAAALVVTLFGFSAHAEEPAGAYAIEVSGSDGLTALVGEAQDCNTRVDTERCLSATFATSATGAITGTGTLTLVELDGDFTGEMALALTGQMGGSIDAPKAAVRFDLAGEIVEPADDPNLPPRVLDLDGDGRMSCKLDFFADVMRCQTKARFCASDDGRRIGCNTLKFELPVEIERVGFDVNLDLATAEDGALSGSANVAIDGAPVFTYDLGGRYRADRDVSKLTLKSTDPAVKTRIDFDKLALAAGEAEAWHMRFKVAGQKGTSIFPPPPPPDAARAALED
jgi:hypothetical protein